MLSTKYMRACNGYKATKTAFDELSSRIPLHLRDSYEQEEAEALRKGGEALKIYVAKTVPCKYLRILLNSVLFPFLIRIS